MARILGEQSEPAPDRRALLQKALQRACGSCPSRKDCRVCGSLTAARLQKPLELSCQQTGRLLSELRRGQQQWKLLQAERRRREEFRLALLQQYGFLSRYLRRLSGQLLHSGICPLPGKTAGQRGLLSGLSRSGLPVLCTAL